MLLRWVGPALVTVIALSLFQWFVAPSMAALRDDLAFLRAARIQAIQHAQAKPGP